MTMDTAAQPEPPLAHTAQAAFKRLRTELEECIIGQEALVEHLLIALLADGHLLVEGAPGLAKTTAIKELAQRIDGDFHRLQFTPDLLPADLVGTQIYNPKNGEFTIHQGPLFSNLVLADEINRAPAKVQSDLLEAMRRDADTPPTARPRPAPTRVPLEVLDRRPVVIDTGTGGRLRKPAVGTGELHRGDEMHVRVVDAGERDRPRLLQNPVNARETAR